MAGVVLTTLGLRQVGGWSGLHEKLGPEMFQMVKPLMDHWLLKPWLHTAFFNFLVCSAILVAVSLITRPASTAQLATTTVSDWKSLLAAERVPFYRNYLFWLGLLLTICTAMWYAMR